MNNQNPQMFQPGYLNNNCQCSREIRNLSNQINNINRELRRLERRIQNLERDFLPTTFGNPTPLNSSNLEYTSDNYII